MNLNEKDKNIIDSGPLPPIILYPRLEPSIVKVSRELLDFSLVLLDSGV